MEFSGKKSIKMTTGLQFQKLVNCMEEYPHLATGTPQFGSSKAAMEQTWETVAKKINAYGPPARSANEWKKVWADLKCRLKKKIADNNKSLHNTGGGPCRVNNLTELENDIDRICHISAAAAPSGKVYGFPKTCNTKGPTSTREIVLDETPPRRSHNVAVVTPTSCAVKVPQTEECFPQEWAVYNESPPTTSKKLVPESYRMTRPVTSTPKPESSTNKRKRKHKDNAAEGQERLKLLRQQYEIQAETLEAIKSQAKATKECVSAIKECSEALQTQSASLKIMAESMKLMTKAMFDVVMHFIEEKK